MCGCVEEEGCGGVQKRKSRALTPSASQLTQPSVLWPEVMICVAGEAGLHSAALNRGEGHL